MLLIVCLIPMIRIGEKRRTPEMPTFIMALTSFRRGKRFSFQLGFLGSQWILIHFVIWFWEGLTKDGLSLSSSHTLLCVGQKRLLKKITRVQKDGTLDLDFDEDDELAASLFGSEAGKRHGDEDIENGEDGSVERVPPLRIVMLVVGTRGDVQPFLAIGKKMQVFSRKLNPYWLFPTISLGFALFDYEKVKVGQVSRVGLWFWYDGIGRMLPYASELLVEYMTLMQELIPK
jgi:hypothetical protein